jgi:hypothetical protein
MTQTDTTYKLGSTVLPTATGIEWWCLVNVIESLLHYCRLLFVHDHELLPYVALSTARKQANTVSLNSNDYHDQTTSTSPSS